MTRHRIPMGQLDLGRVSSMRHGVDMSWARADRAMDSDVGQILTARRMDEAQVAGTRVYIGAHAQLLNAMDNLDGLWALLQHHGATTWAPWNLLRPAFEAAFRALWVLEPTEGLTRRRRGLRLEVDNYVQRLNHLQELVAIPERSKLVGGELARSQADVESVYRREAEALGLTYGQARQQINVVDELRRLDATKALGPDSAAMVPACWRVLSGSQHGLPYAALQNSDIEVQAPMPGGQRVLASMKDQAFESHTSVTLWLVWQACDRLANRCTRP